MNWIILIVAGFFESGFAFCLGKIVRLCFLFGEDERSVWNRMVPLGCRIPCLSWTEYALARQSSADIACRHSLSRVDGHWRSRHSSDGNRVFSRANLIPAPVLHLDTDCFDCRIESGIGIILQEVAENDFSHKRFMQGNGETIFVLFSDFPYLRN